MSETTTTMVMETSAPNTSSSSVICENEASSGSAVVTYLELCEVFELIEATTKRIQITKYLQNFFLTCIQRDPDSLVKAVYLCLNKICPDAEGKEFGIGESLIMKAIGQVTGSTLALIKKEHSKKGDLGQVAQDNKKGQKRIDHSFSAKNTNKMKKGLTIAQVFDTLYEIASISGTKSQVTKIDKIVRILMQCQDQEPKFFVRSLEGKLRIGLAERTGLQFPSPLKLMSLSVLAALARSFVLSDPNSKNLKEDKLEKELSKADAILKQVFSEIPNYDVIIPALLRYGIGELPDHCKLTPGFPLKPMLAHPTKSLTEVLDRFVGMTFTCEYKYDGERAQIHQFRDASGEKKLMVFSRNSENLSAKYPDIIVQMPEAPIDVVESFVLDCEAVAWDVSKKCILPFQVLQTRKRKDVQEEDVLVSVCIFAFDLLYLNGEAITGKCLKERRALMFQNFKEIEGKFAFAKSIDTKNIEEIQTFLDDSIIGNCEGLMVKTLESEATYEPSKRSRNWLKVKKDYLEGFGDTLDLVVIGAYFGKGKRTGVYGGYLLACFDEESEKFQTICKIGTGFSEANLTDQFKFFQDIIDVDGPSESYSYSDTPNHKPDIWFHPKIVFEVKAADLSISPVHQAATGLIDGNEEKGISLRFPRFMRIREDKNATDATTSHQVKDMYESQVSVQNGKSENNGATGVDDDFEY
ncbi:hypothetical protein HDU92_006364 [Lobulomyces angularis]|nr:hypothetical protein HDU92_006364 [Lobulomyces angularis]